MNKTVHRDKRGFLPRITRPRIFAFLELSNTLLNLLKVFGGPIASELDVARRQICRSNSLAEVAKVRHELRVVWEDDSIWQKRSDTALRETFTNTGISGPFGWCSELTCVFPEKALCVVRDRKSFSAGHLVLRYMLSNVF